MPDYEEIAKELSEELERREIRMQAEAVCMILVNTMEPAITGELSVILVMITHLINSAPDDLLKQVIRDKVLEAIAPK